MLSLLIALLGAVPITQDAAQGAPLRLNDIEAVGTHNSYKLAVPADEMAAMVAAGGEPALGLDYGHRPLTEQLDQGARQLELDVVRDPDGGRFATPRTALGQGAGASPAWKTAMAR